MRLLHLTLLLLIDHSTLLYCISDNADQVVMMIRNIRRSMVEYHDILWDIGYAKTWEEATLNLDNLYGERPPVSFFSVLGLSCVPAVPFVVRDEP